MYAGRKAVGFSQAAVSKRVFTGKFDCELRFEIDDSASTLHEDRLSAVLLGSNSKLSELLHHPELFENYPVLANLPVKGMRTSDFASYSPRFGEMHLSTERIDARTARTWILHEVQHAIQQIEEFDAGASYQLIGFKLMIEHRKEIGARPGAPLSSDVVRGMSDEAYKTYLATTGEIEARDVELRADFNKEERAACAPYSSEGYTLQTSVRPDHKAGFDEILVRKTMQAKQLIHKHLSQSPSLGLGGAKAANAPEQKAPEPTPKTPWDASCRVSVFMHPADAPHSYTNRVVTSKTLSGDELAAQARKLQIEELSTDGGYQWFTSRPDSKGNSFTLHLHEVDGMEPTAKDFRSVAEKLGVSMESANSLTMET